MFGQDNLRGELGTFPPLTGGETKTQESLVRQDPWQINGWVGPLGLFPAWPSPLLLGRALLLLGELLTPPFIRYSFDSQSG